jgi:hypothetical protein
MISPILTRFALGAAFLSAFGTACAHARTVQAPETFHRDSPATDPVTGAVAGKDMPDIWNLEMPTWPPNRGFKRISGTNFVVGVGRAGELYGTPDVSGQAALFVSADEGRTWRYRGALPCAGAADHIERITSLCCGAGEVLFASTAQGGLYETGDGFVTISPNLIPGWYRSVAPRTAFNGDLLVERVNGRATEHCKVLACFYGQRLEGTQKSGSLCVFRTDISLGQMAAGARPGLRLAWRQDAFDFYARHMAGAGTTIKSAGSIRFESGSGMHLHSAAWEPRSCNGESNVLFISFGDKAAGHICRVAAFDQLPPAGEDGRGSGRGWNYSDTQVFALRQQPTGMWATNGRLFLLARDCDGSTMVTPDDVFNPQELFSDSFAPHNSPYSGVNYDSWVWGRAAIVASLVEREAGQFGVLVGDPTAPQQMFRFVRGLSADGASNYTGFSAVYGNEQNDVAVVTADAFGSGAPVQTWLIHAPALVQIAAVLVANAGDNLIPGAGFDSDNGIRPNRWRVAAGRPACSSVAHDDHVYGGGNFWRIAMTNDDDLVQFNVDTVLSNSSPGSPLCASVAYRFPGAYRTATTDGASFRVEWRDANKILRVDTVGGLQSATTNQWRTASMKVVPPQGAAQGRFSILCHNYTGAVDIAMPWAAWNHFTAPAAGRREADLLEYDSKDADWDGCNEVRAGFLVLPLWPTDIDPGGPQTICSMQSSDGTRCWLTWDYALGFRAALQSHRGELLAELKLGQLRGLTRFDPCRFSLEFKRGTMTATLDAGADVLQATAAITDARIFKPVKIRLGGDLFSGGRPGWEGYYALLACEGMD